MALAMKWFNAGSSVPLVARFYTYLVHTVSVVTG